MAVGVDSYPALIAFQRQRLERLRADDASAELRHLTRHMPKRADELLAGGSIYWIIRGQICARQRILRLDRIEGPDALRRCAIVLDPTVHATTARPARPMQGWRYLAAKDAPDDLAIGATAKSGATNETMVATLKSLGLA
ncbi:MAG: DUF1489 family protein [Alphaproteobacteria bacterium]|nr:DUF1489 family protein [Alphaproteobacteria bacterium]